MRWFDLVAMKLAMLFGRRTAGNRLDEELRFHLERQIAENRSAGMNADEANYAALRSFGNPALLREQARDNWSWRGAEQALREVRYGIRTLRRTPGFAIIAVLVMALGIGANVALFTVVRGVLLKPLPFKDPDRLMMLYESNLKDETDYNIVAGGVYAEWKNHNQTFSDLALVQTSRYSLSASGGQLPETLRGAQISWNLLTTLGVQPALGRDFTASDDTPSASFTAILSWSLWKRRFGSNPGILNQTVYIDAKPYTVIGIMPEWFAFPEPEMQIWTAVYRDKPAAIISMIDNHMFNVVGRLKPGVSPAQGAADVNLISRRLHEAHLDDPAVQSGARGRPLLDSLVGDFKRPLYVLLAATGCLLLIACMNVANLLVARAIARRKEFAIRTAMGGGRIRLLRERLMESLILSAAGGALGLLLAFAVLEWLTRTRQDMSRVESIHIDGVVAAFTVGVIAFCALFAGLISALTVRDRHLLAALHEASRSTSGSQTRATLRRVLLTLEVGLTVVLLIGAGLLLKSYQRLRSADMGCATQNVLTMRFALPGVRYKTPGPMPVNFFDALLSRLRALPGVDAVGLVTAIPGQGYWEDSDFTIVEHPPLPRGIGTWALNRWADSGYFAAMGIPILRGRTFNESLRLDQANEVIINNVFARKYFPGEDPIGKHLKTEGKVHTIVGMVGDTRFEIGEPPREMKYFSLNAGGENYGTLVIRSRGDVEQLALPVQQVIQGMDRDLSVSDVLTMDQLLGKTTLDKSFNTTLLTGFAALSLLLAAVGLFGVLSYMAAQRTGEIGIRLALGAPREHVLGKMLSDGLRPALIGLVLGLAASAAVSRLMQEMLYETRPLDPPVFVAVSATLMLVAALACLVPAWRASRVDPVQALRTE
ncbi:MAG TPA: ABC transporter permease [Terracidiphilus sp.]